MAAQVRAIQRRIEGLKTQLKNAECEVARARRRASDDRDFRDLNGNAAEQDGLNHSIDNIQAVKWPLSNKEYKRYGRQLIMLEIGLRGQLRLKSSSVLVVGAGGLGCPAAAYIARAGIGTIGVLDGDTIETSNLHRQILHRSDGVGKSEVDSVIEYLTE